MKFFRTLLYLWLNAIKSIFCVLLALVIVIIFNKFGLSIFNGIYAINIDDFLTVSNFNIIMILPVGIFLLSPWKNFYNEKNFYSLKQIVLKTLFHSVILEFFYIFALAILTPEFSKQGLITIFNESIFVVLIANLLSLGRFR